MSNNDAPSYEPTRNLHRSREAADLEVYRRNLGNTLAEIGLTIMGAELKRLAARFWRRGYTPDDVKTAILNRWETI